MADPVTIDRTVISWLLGLAASFILFLLGLGAKDIKDKLRKVDDQCRLIILLRGDMDRHVTELRGEIALLKQRLEQEKIEWSGKR
jgi:hypothetical protein